MALDPIITGALISAGGALLGGAVGDARAPGVAKRVTAAEMRSKIITGREFGLHPLASIGAQTSGYSGSYLGDGIAEASRSVGQAVQERGREKKSAVLDAKRGELVDAQIAEARSRTLLNEANARSVGAVDPFKPRKENALVEVMLENGDIIFIPNPDLYEVSPTELATGRSLIEAARIAQKKVPEVPDFPANPQLGDLFRPEGRYEYQFTRSGWRQRRKRNGAK